MESTRATSEAKTAGSALSSSTLAHLQRRHPASLIPRFLHDPVLLSLIKAPVNHELIDYVTKKTLAVVATPTESTQLPTPPPTPVKSTFRKSLSRKGSKDSATESTASPSTSESTSSDSSFPSLSTFIKLTASKSNAQAPTLLITLVYLERLKKKLTGAKAAKGMQCTYHRLFLAALIAAAKYCNDCCPRNSHWVKWSGMFTLTEVNLMEQELLMLLDYDLRVDETALILICAPFLPASSLKRVTEMDRSTSAMESGATSCAASRSSSSESSTAETILSTPYSSPVLIKVNDELVQTPPSSTLSSSKKHSNKSLDVGHHATSVVTRAKSWYGNLRANS